MSGLTTDVTPVTSLNNLVRAYFMSPPNENQLNRILTNCVDFAYKKGLKGLSLRSLAKGANMSARMLIHYFGTSENLFGKIMHQFIELEKARADKLCLEAQSQSDPLLFFIEKYIFSLTSSKFLPVVNNIFEMYGAAIIGNSAVSDLLDDVLAHWISRVKVLAPNFNDEQAGMVMAFANGSIFDLLATKDKKRVSRSIQEFVKMFEYQSIHTQHSLKVGRELQ